MMLWSFLNYIMLKFSKDSRKKLIAIGCSYTDDWNNRSRIPPEKRFPSWPHLLAETLDMQCINLGRSGAGNDEILSNLIDTVLNQKNIGLVVIMWSEWQRISFQMRYRRPSEWWHVNTMRKAGECWLEHVARSRWIPDFQLSVDEWAPNLLGAINPHHSCQTALRNFILAQNLLKDIPYLFIQGPAAMTYYNVKTLKYIDCSQDGPNGESIDFYRTNNSRQQTAIFLTNSPYLKHIETNRFIGWPIFAELGGYNVDDMLDKIDPKRTRTRIGPDDTHPNRVGYEIITQEIYNAYEKVYT